MYFSHRSILEFIRRADLVEVKHLADFGLDLAGIDQATNLAELFPVFLNDIVARTLNSRLFSSNGSIIVETRMPPFFSRL